MDAFLKMLDINLDTPVGYLKILGATFILSFVFNLVKDLLNYIS